MYSVPDSRNRYARRSRQLGNRQLPLGSFELAVESCIVGLFQSRRPLAIARFVVAVVVYPLGTHAVWTVPHVRQEVLELLPPLTHCDPTPSVAMVARSLGVFAPGLHRTPDRIDRCLGSQPPKKAGNASKTQQKQKTESITIAEIGVELAR